MVRYMQRSSFVVPTDETSVSRRSARQPEMRSMVGLLLAVAASSACAVLINVAAVPALPFAPTLGVAPLPITHALPTSALVAAAPTDLPSFVQDALAFPIVQEALSLPYTVAAVEFIGGVLAGTPLAAFTDSPLFPPLASGVALYAALAAALFVGRIILQLAVTVLLKGTAGNPSVPYDRYDLGRRLGGGNYGSVYEGFKGNEADPSVVIKTAKLEAQASEFALAELFVNKKLSLCGASRCMARFEGHYYDDAGALSLVFKKEGTLTLDKAMQGDFPYNMADAMMRGGGGSEEERGDKTIRKIASQIFRNLADVHSWGIVHRDIKGENMIFAESERRFKIIDFGVACDLLSRTNYDPNLQPFDPKFSPPEAPPAEGGLVLSSGGRFDVFSAGLLIVQMCFRAYRSDSGMCAPPAHQPNYALPSAQMRHVRSPPLLPVTLDSDCDPS